MWGDERLLVFLLVQQKNHSPFKQDGYIRVARCRVVSKPYRATGFYFAEKITIAAPLDNPAENAFI
jgi:hypothetical protein